MRRSAKMAAVIAVVVLCALAFARMRSTGPVVSCPLTVELARQNPGVIRASIRVSNRGTSDLQVTGFRRSCGCLAVLKEIGGTRMPLEDEIIAPGQSIDA